MSTSNTRTKIFLGAGGDIFTVNDSGTTLIANSGSDAIKLGAGVGDVTTDANIERIELPGKFSDYKFGIVAGSGVQVQSATGGVICTIPSLNQNATLAFSDGAATLIQTSGAAFSLGGTALTSTGAAVAATLNTADKSSVGTTTGFTKARVFLSAGDSNFTVSNSGTTLIANSGVDTVKIAAGVTDIKTDANLERIELAGNLADYLFGIVAGSGVQIQSATGVVIGTIPSLNQNMTVAFADGSTSLTQTGGALFALGGAAIGVGAAARMTVTLDTSDKSTVPGMAAADTTSPVFASATVSGGTLIMSYTDASTLDAAHAPASGAFAVLVDGVANAVAAVAVDAAAKTVTLTLTSAVINGAVVTVGYADPTAGNDVNAIQDAAGNDAMTITAQAVTNTTNAAAMQFVLSTADDVKLGGAGDDTFIGLFSNGGGGSNTFNIGDALSGNGGADTLMINNQSSGAAISLDDTFWAHTSTIENVVITETGAGVQTIITNNNFNTAFAAGVHFTAKSTAGAIGVTMGGAVAETATLTTTSTGGIQTIDTGSGTGAVTVEATSTGGALNVTGADLVSVTTNSTAGIQTILSTGTRAVTVNATSTTGAQTITTGAGNDTIIVHSTAGATINAGGGKDAVTLDASHVAVQAVTITPGASTQAAFDTITNFGIMTGAGSDTLSLGSTTLLTAAQLGAGWTNGAGVATKAGATLADFLLAATTSTISGVAAYCDGSNTYVVASDGLVSGAVDTVVELVGINTATAVANAVATTTIHIV